MRGATPDLATELAGHAVGQAAQQIVVDGRAHARLRRLLG
jgi:hypothetical protein